jgi:hypothetical protein
VFNIFISHVYLYSTAQQISAAVPVPMPPCDEIRQRIIFMGQELADAQVYMYINMYVNMYKSIHV